MLDQRITTVFLSMALMAATVSFLSFGAPTTFIWLAFLYFVANKIRFFQGDIRLSDAFRSVCKQSSHHKKMIDMFLGSLVLLLFVIAGLKVVHLTFYFSLTAAALLVDSIWLGLLRNCVDEAKGIGNRVGMPIKIVLKNWMIIDFIENSAGYPPACWREERGYVRTWRGASDAPQLAAGCFTEMVFFIVLAIIGSATNDLTGNVLILHQHSDLHIVTYILFGCLFFLLVTDIFVHSKFLFHTEMNCVDGANDTLPPFSPSDKSRDS